MEPQDLCRSIHALGVEVRARTGRADVVLLRQLKASCRIAEVIGRVCLHFAVGPWVWLFGLLSLAYQLSVEAQLNHSIMHGAYVGLPGAEGFTPSRYEALALPFQSRTWRDAHRIHHQHRPWSERTRTRFTRCSACTSVSAGGRGTS